LTALGITEISDEVRKLGVRSPTISTFCARVRAYSPSSRTSWPPCEANSPRRAEPKSSIRSGGRGRNLIEREDVAVTVTMPATSSARPGRISRAGRAARAAPAWRTREEDFVTHIFVANTHAPLLFFSSIGMVYRLKVWRLPEARIQGRARRW